jgi:hypothetical protein
MRQILHSILLLGLFSCTKTNQQTENKLDIVADSADYYSASLDTLRSRGHYYYLADIKLRTIGQLILSDSIAPSDNYITFSCMDSITSRNKQTRDYFFPVFIKIVEKSDGALAEVVGSYILNYTKSYPKELADRFECCSTSKQCCDELRNLSFYVGQEIMLSDEWQKEYDDLLRQMTKNYRDWRKDKILRTLVDHVDNVRQSWAD